MSSGSEAPEKPQQVHVAKSNLANPLLAVAGARLFPTATPRAVPLPDSFIITYKPGLYKIK